MAGKRVYISFAAEDAAQCNLLTAALDAWEVAYTTARPALSQGDQLPDVEKVAIRDCEVFLRLCTAATKRSESIHQDLRYFDTLQAEDRSKHQREQRALVNLILDANYQREPFDNVTLFIDTANKSRAFWLDELSRPLGVATQARRLSRRSALALGVAGAVTLMSGGTAATLFVRDKAAADAAANKPQLGPVTHASGQIAWTINLSRYLGDKDVNPLYTTNINVAAGDNVIYAASWNGLFALNLQGQLLWNYAGFQKANGFQYIDLADGTANLVNGILFANKDIIIANVIEQSSRHISVISIHDQSLVSQVSVNYTGPLTVVGNSFYCNAVSDTATGLFAFDLLSGKMLWNTALGIEGPPPALTYSAGKLYTGDPYHFTCFNARDGKQIWQYHLPTVIGGTATVANGMVYFGSRDGFVYALDAQTGKLRWRYQIQAPIVAQPLVNSGIVYIGDASGYLLALNGQTGDIYWRLLVSDQGPNVFEPPGSLSATIISQPVIYKNVIAALAGGILTTFDIISGKLRWSLLVNGDGTQYDRSASGPLASNGFFIVGSGDGKVIAVNP